MRENYIENVIIGPIFMLDNAKIDHYSDFKEIISEMDVKFINMTAYSSFLNPIENIFSIWKNKVIIAEVNNENGLD